MMAGIPYAPIMRPDQLVEDQDDAGPLLRTVPEELAMVLRRAARTVIGSSEAGSRIPELTAVQHWPLASDGAHGMDINHAGNRLYVACDGGLLVEVDIQSGQTRREWPLAGVPDATFFNPKSGLVHVAIEDPGLIQTVDPPTNISTQFITAKGAKTTALVEPDRLYVFSPLHQGVLDLKGA